jgi:hypothetical protein
VRTAQQNRGRCGREDNQTPSLTRKGLSLERTEAPARKTGMPTRRLLLSRQRQSWTAGLQLCPRTAQRPTAVGPTFMAGSGYERDHRNHRGPRAVHHHVYERPDQANHRSARYRRRRQQRSPQNHLAQRRWRHLALALGVAFSGDPPTTKDVSDLNSVWDRGRGCSPGWGDPPTGVEKKFCRGGEIRHGAGGAQPRRLPALGGTRPSWAGRQADPTPIGQSPGGGGTNHHHGGIQRPILGIQWPQCRCPPPRSCGTGVDGM